MKSTSPSLEGEWITLQTSYDSYEKCSLGIKLFSVAISTTLVFHQKLDFVVFSLCAVLWMVDAIWKTFQARTEQRLLVVEKEISQQSENVAMQFHTQWQQNRPTTAGLIIEYAKHGLSPTVGVPHLSILVVCAIVMWWL